MMNFLKSYSHFSNILYKDFPRVSYLSNMKGIFNVKFIGKQYIKQNSFNSSFLSISGSSAKQSQNMLKTVQVVSIKNRESEH